MIDPYSSELVEDYSKIVEEFGLERFDLKAFPDPNRMMRRGAVFAGRDLKVISDCIRKKKPFYVLSGIMPTAERVHLGNKMVVDNIRYFQDHGGKAYILVADMEAAAARGIELSVARENALKFHIPAYIALGLDMRKTTFYFQSDNLEVLRLAYEFSKRITLNEFRAIYGNADPGRIISALTQAADILYPQLRERMPGIIPVGIDQEPHIRLTRDIVARTKSKYDFFPPASIYHSFMPSLDGKMKMSKSNESSYLSIPEDPKSACKKVKCALTGGRETVEIQKKLGGIPEKCMVYELYKLHLVDDDSRLAEIYGECKAGRLLCGQDKEDACSLLTGFFSKLSLDIGKVKIGDIDLVK